MPDKKYNALNVVSNSLVSLHWRTKFKHSSGLWLAWWFFRVWTDFLFYSGCAFISSACMPGTFLKLVFIKNLKSGCGSLTILTCYPLVHVQPVRGSVERFGVECRPCGMSKLRMVPGFANKKQSNSRSPKTRCTFRLSTSIGRVHAERNGRTVRSLDMVAFIF